jgi:hypothetical protein
MSGTAVFNTFVTSLISFGTSAGPAGGPPAGPGNSGFTIQGSPRFPGGPGGPRGPSPQVEVISKCPKTSPYYCGTNTNFGRIGGRGQTSPCVKNPSTCDLYWEIANNASKVKPVSKQCTTSTDDWNEESQECKSVKKEFKSPRSPRSAFRFY